MSPTASDPRDRVFERLYRRHATDVYRFALAVVRNPTDAEDVTQTAFLNAYRALKRGERPERPRSWLFAIAHNAIRSRHRWARRRPREVPLDEALRVLAAPADERVELGEVLAALGDLPATQREALALRELEGRSYSEIAGTLGVSVGAVESLIARGRRTLRRQRAALRGLVALQLPRALRLLAGHGDDASGGLAAKTTAIVAAAGLAAGGVGLGRTVAGAPPQRAAAAPAPAPATAGMAARPAPVRVALVVARAPARASSAVAQPRRHRSSTPAPPAPAASTASARLAPTAVASSGATSTDAASTAAAPPVPARAAPAPVSEAAVPAGAVSTAASAVPAAAAPPSAPAPVTAAAASAATAVATAATTVAAAASAALPQPAPLPPAPVPVPSVPAVTTAVAVPALPTSGTPPLP